MLRALIFISALWMVCVALAPPCSAQSATLQQATGGIAISGTKSPFDAGFGSVNGLGIGTPATGLTKIAVAGGEFYYTPYTLVATASATKPVLVDAYVSTGFTNPGTILQLLSCPYPNACNTYAGYTALPTSPATEITVLPSQTANGNYTAYLGLFVANTNGSIATPDTAQISFDVYDASSNKLKSTQVLRLDSPNVTVQTAVQMQLATAPSGTTITLNSPTTDPNFTANFGTVNGLGVGIASPFTLINGQSPGGIIYATPYLIQPAFSGFTSANATKITVFISTDFTHSNVLTLYDSANPLTGYTAIGKSSGSANQITASAGNGTAITEYLGLFVSNLNGGTSYRGSDHATLTYTITVQ